MINGNWFMYNGYSSNPVSDFSTFHQKMSKQSPDFEFEENQPGSPMTGFVCTIQTPWDLKSYSSKPCMNKKQARKNLCETYMKETAPRFDGDFDKYRR